MAGNQIQTQPWRHRIKSLPFCNVIANGVQSHWIESDRIGSHLNRTNKKNKSHEKNSHKMIYVERGIIKWVVVIHRRTLQHKSRAIWFTSRWRSSLLSVAFEIQKRWSLSALRLRECAAFLVAKGEVFYFFSLTTCAHTYVDMSRGLYCFPKKPDTGQWSLSFLF